MAYCTLSSVKDYINLTASDDDALLLLLLDAAQRAIDVYTGRQFEAATDSTRRLHFERDIPHYNRRLLLLDEDICQVSSIINGDGAVIPASAYVLRPRSTPYYAVELKAGGDYAWTFDTTPEDAIAVTGRWAYSVTAPADVVYAAIRLTSFMYRQRDTQTDADRPMMSASGALLMPPRLPEDVQALLQPYVRMSVP